ncbi:ribose ABC transporter [Paracoccus limosus]|jgi:L-fucose mutarotase|uniref:Ribose ABC transporter n=1 Tax=Paracoccus limosus TaxID=913252 RepID=A0A844H1U9_9RHOB|nr:RbsD/FucU domain-containing protein [Paracoccus limosus]MTH33524.1 ribose ABC transporter [Paracoccus limosus]
MLKGIDPRISPDLLYALAQMGHGDDIAIVDANFPAHALSGRVIQTAARLPGALQMVLSLLPLDSFVPAAAISMQVVDDPEAVPPAIDEIVPVIQTAGSVIQSVDRFSFYDLTRGAFAVLQTIDTRLYANVILKKGVISPDASI